MGALLLLVLAYLLLSYSVFFAVLVIGTLALAVLLVRKNRGTQTEFERRLFEAAVQSRRSARRAYEEANARYQRWSREQATEEERRRRRAELDRYGRFFERALGGTRNCLDWWNAYDEGEFDGVGTPVSDLLQSALDRAESGLSEVRSTERRLEESLRGGSFEEADRLLGGLRKGQEDFERGESVFPPLVEVHERLKRSEKWADYRQELEKLARDLEDLLGSLAVRTSLASRARFSYPAGSQAQGVRQQPAGSYPTDGPGYGSSRPPSAPRPSTPSRANGHITDGELEELIGQNINGTALEIANLVRMTAKIVADKGYWQKPASIDGEAIRHLLELLFVLARADGRASKPELDVIKSLGGESLSYQELGVSYRELEFMADASFAKAGEFVSRTPEYFRAIVAHDKDNGTDLAAITLFCIANLGRKMIAADSHVGEKEVAVLTKHLAHLRGFMESQGVSAAYVPGASAPSEDTKSAEHPATQTAQEVPPIDELLATLHRLVGLSRVKEEVETLTNLLRVRQERAQRGLPVPPMSFHLVFAGNPGTGKTTVARLLASIYRSLGLLSKGHLKEVDRSGLVAAYMGQTAIKVQEVVKEAIGGILFIDEAYALVAGRHETDYGKEAVDTLLKLMEDHRDDLVVIVAGYPDEMGEFLRSNPGLQSRFNKFIHFEDYSPEEMWEIFERVCEDYGYQLTPAAREHVRSTFEEMHANKGENFGNARAVRNLFERAVSNHANRVAATSDANVEELSTLHVADFPAGRVA